jgi:hypothetical protein
MQRTNIVSTIPAFLTADKIILEESSQKKRFSVWSKIFEKSHRALFNTYFNWGNRQMGQAQFKDYKKYFNSLQIIKNEQFAWQAIPIVADKVAAIMPFLKTLPVVLFVGLYQTNGFVDKYKGRYTTFLNLECYNDRHTLKIFIAHELAHNVHLIKNPIYYWQNNKSNWYNSLILEGAATYITKQALGINYSDALWGNYLSIAKKKRFMHWCDKNLKFLKKELLKNIDKTKREESRFFGAKRPKGCPYYRTGYYLGTELVKYLLTSNSLEEIVMLKGAKLKMITKEFLIK